MPTAGNFLFHRASRNPDERLKEQVLGMVGNEGNSRADRLSEEHLRHLKSEVRPLASDYADFPQMSEGQTE